MTRSHFRPNRLRLPTLALLLGLVLAAWHPAAARNLALRAVLIGGGPDPQHNQVAIERNVYYVSHLLPSDAPRFVLFTNGDPESRTVLYEEPAAERSRGERAFRLLFLRGQAARQGADRYRPPDLGRLDGPAKRSAIASVFERLRAGEPDPLLLYFTGHGSPARDKNLDNNNFDLWGEELSVRDLAAHVANLPPDVPVTLVMVQCFSGAFGNLVFQGGDPKAPPVERQIAGFFAAPRERMAAGCTPEVNEAEYRDFTSYFFAALSGRDRVGRRVTGPDYNHDGRVGMDEAFAYSVSHDVSIDVPVCTSDVFLRAVVPAEDPEVFETGYSRALAWAAPAQRAALEELSHALGFSGEGQLAPAYRMMIQGARPGDDPDARATRDRFGRARRATQDWVLSRYPQLRRGQAAFDSNVRQQVAADLSRHEEESGLRELLAAEDALRQGGGQELQSEVAQARLLRFVRLAKSIILAHRLRENGSRALRDRFERLLTAEAGTLVPPAGPAGR